MLVTRNVGPESMLTPPNDILYALSDKTTDRVGHQIAHHSSYLRPHCPSGLEVELFTESPELFERIKTQVLKIMFSSRTRDDVYIALERYKEAHCKKGRFTIILNGGTL